MPKYNCTVIFDASSTINVKADSPEEAAMLAEDMTSGNQTLCHQCSNTLETGDAIGVHVYDEDSTEHFLDTTHRGQPAAQFAGSYGIIDESAAKRIATALGWEPKREWVGLTQQDIDIAFDDTQEGGGFNEFARAIEKTLRRKNNG